QEAALLREAAAQEGTPGGTAVRCRILLTMDEGHGQPKTYQECADSLGIARSTVERTVRRCSLCGAEAAVWPERAGKEQKERMPNRATLTVQLEDWEVSRLEGILARGDGGMKRMGRCRILLAMDEGQGPRKHYRQCAMELGMSAATVSSVVWAYHAGGIDAVLGKGYLGTAVRARTRGRRKGQKG
ncbi:MAG: hypothetical protein NC489_37965, partial [Ruminococcus flavefaciens]|nr:hypothetical protein [Ruminococcus flavefaciens]